MHLDHVPSILSSLAADAVVAFVVAVLIDDFLGVVAAAKSKTFDWNKLPSFLESQFGTKQAAALGGIILAAYVTGSIHDLKEAHQAALAAVTAGGGALTLSVLRDCVDKLRSLAGRSEPVSPWSPLAPPK